MSKAKQTDVNASRKEEAVKQNENTTVTHFVYRFAFISHIFPNLYLA